MIRLGVPADLAAVAGVYRRASLSNPGDRDNLLAHPEYLIMGPWMSWGRGAHGPLK
jgi:hypothetical protein